MALDVAPVSIAIGPPGHALFTAGDESLVCSAMNALAGVRIRVAGRFMHLDGRVEPIVQTFAPASDRSVSVNRVALAAGWLLNAQASVVAGAPLTGQTFAVLSIVRGRTGAFEELATLAAGPITAVQRLAWPGSIVGNSLESAGALRSITGSTPAAGAEVSETVPTGARWDLLAFKATLTADATVATRIPVFTIDDGTTQLFASAAVQVRTASGGTGFFWAQGTPYTAIVNATTTANGLPVGLRLGAGYRIRTSTLAMVAGDQWSAVQYLVREWIEGA